MFTSLTPRPRTRLGALIPLRSGTSSRSSNAAFDQSATDQSVQSLTDDRFESVGFLELLNEALAEAGELVVDGFVIGLGLRCAHVSAGGEHEVLLLQLVEPRDLAESGHVLVVD